MRAWAERVSAELELPLGMRDRVGPEVAARDRLAAAVRATFLEAGYVRVATPIYEYEEVVTRGLGVDARTLVRFVEPGTGRVCVLRPDLTPQIARLVATRLSGEPPPFRFCTEGSVVRLPLGRSRPERQVAQAGVELLGVPAPAGDAEVITLCARAVARAGVRRFLVELADASLAAAALADVEPAFHERVRERLAAKDADGLSAILDAAGAPPAARRILEALPELYGGAGVLARARRRLTGPAARAALEGLASVVAALERARLFAALRREGVRAELAFDLGEVRGWGYYTGVRFAVLAGGPGVPVASGGRYDGLHRRFGRDLCATGFAVDLDALEVAVSEGVAA
jgi:ATP phosphoribosyltransferase regulatory subunit